MSQGRKIPKGIRSTVGELLRSDDFSGSLADWNGLPLRKIVNQLFSYLYTTDELLKWRTVTAMGRVVAGLAEEDMESARNVMRRLIWNLNDESGGIGWGSPEAMGEIMACHSRMAEEYSQILFSYIRLDGNHIGNELLERGVLWGLGRLSQVRPHLLRDVARHVIPYLKSADLLLRGHAAWMLSYVKIDGADLPLKPLLKDTAEITVFEDGNLIKHRICDLAARIIVLPDAG